MEFIKTPASLAGVLFGGLHTTLSRQLVVVPLVADSDKPQQGKTSESPKQQLGRHVQVKSTANWTECLPADGRNRHAYACLQISDCRRDCSRAPFLPNNEGDSMARYLGCFLQGDVSVGSGYRTVREPSCRTGSFEYPVRWRVSGRIRKPGLQPGQ